METNPRSGRSRAAGSVARATPSHPLAIGALTLTAALALGVQAAPPLKTAAADSPRESAAKSAAAGGCVPCHGAAGEGQASFPRLAGLGDAYLLRQLTAFADGSRSSPVMAPIAAALPPADRAALATHFSALTVPASSRQRDAAASVTPDAGGSDKSFAATEMLVTRGRWSDGLPGCEQCHGPGGRGVGPDFPALAGQPADYLAAQLKAWQSGARPPGPLGLMHVVAKKLSEAEVRDLAQYFSALPATDQPTGRKASP